MKYRSKGLSVAFLLMLLPALLLADDGTKKSPPPGPAALTEATKLVNEVYGKNIATKTPDQKKDLIQKLLDASKEEKGAGKYALLTKARDLAVEAGDVSNCDTALNGLEASFDVDTLKARADAYTAIARNVRTPADRKSFAEKLTATVQLALVVDRFDVAKTAAEVGITNARTANDAGLTKLAASDMRSVRETEAAYTEVKKAIVLLVDKPNDSDANLKVGKYRCFMKGDWKNGLPMLALGNDATLKGLAEKEVAGVTGSDEQIKLGDGWWEVGEKMIGGAQKTIQLHAIHWYREALPSMTKGLSRIKVEQRLIKFSNSSEEETPKTGGAAISIRVDVPVVIGRLQKETRQYSGNWDWTFAEVADSCKGFQFTGITGGITPTYEVKVITEGYLWVFGRYDSASETIKTASTMKWEDMSGKVVGHDIGSVYRTQVKKGDTFVLKGSCLRLAASTIQVGK